MSDDNKPQVQAKPAKRRFDFYSGVPWEHVTPEQARNHPKGRLGVVLWAIALYFMAAGIFQFYAAWAAGLGVWLIVLNGIWPFLAGIGLAMRVPWSVFMAIISAGLSVWALIRVTRSVSELYNSFQAVVDLGLLHGVFGVTSYNDAYYLLLLAEVLIQVGILFYLMDGDRPNLIYRHRYRKYSAVDGPRRPTDDDGDT